MFMNVEGFGTGLCLSLHFCAVSLTVPYLWDASEEA